MTTTATTTTTGQKNNNICNANNNNNKKDSKTNNGFRIEIFLQIQNKAVAKNKCYIFSDAFKLCYIHQRPFPQRVDSIGSWQTAMEVLLLSIFFFINIHGLGNGIHSCAGQLWADRALWAGSQNLPQHHRQSNGDLSSLRST